jgi:dolichol kinase
VGDTTAYYTGKKWGTKKLPWNEDKSYIGSIGFFIVGSVIALLFLSPFAGQFIPIGPIIGGFHWIWIALITSLISAFVESLNIRITDNFTVPAISSLFLALAVIVF